MPRQNRVDPFGNLHAKPERGALMGNRGCLHDDCGSLGRPGCRRKAKAYAGVWLYRLAGTFGPSFLGEAMARCGSQFAPHRFRLREGPSFRIDQIWEPSVLA